MPRCMHINCLIGSLGELKDCIYMDYLEFQCYFCLRDHKTILVDLLVGEGGVAWSGGRLGRLVVLKRPGADK